MERLWSFDWDTADSWFVIPGDTKGRGWAKAIRFEFLPSGKRLCFSGGGFHKLHACHRVLEEIHPSLHRFAIIHGTSVFGSIECHPASVLQNHRLYSSFIIYLKWTISIYSWRGYLSFMTTLLLAICQDPCLNLIMFSSPAKYTAYSLLTWTAWLHSSWCF